VTGMVVPPNDPAALRQAMQRIGADAQLAEEMGQRARARFDELFTAEQMARSYVDLYRQVLGGKDHA